MDRTPRFCSSRVAVRIDVGPPCLRIEFSEDVLPDERLAIDESDPAVCPLEEPQVAVARDVDQSLDRPAAAREVNEDRRRDFVPVPRFVRVVLKVALHLAGRGIERYGRRCEEVVAGPLIAHPGSAVAGPPERQVRLRIVRAGDPDRTAASPPLISGRPRFAAGLAGRRYRVGSPDLLARLGIVGSNESANAQLAARRADNDLTF